MKYGYCPQCQRLSPIAKFIAGKIVGSLAGATAGAGATRNPFGSLLTCLGGFVAGALVDDFMEKNVAPRCPICRSVLEVWDEGVDSP